MEFWYRQSPRQFEPVAFWEWFFPGRVTETDQPSDTSGMATVWLSPRGNPWPLRASAAGGECLLTSAAAGLEPFVRRGRSGSAKWLATTPQWTPPIYADERMAWQGSLPERPSVPVRIEAAAYRGKPVYFQFVDPRLDYTWPHEIVRAYAWNSEANSSAFPQERHRLPSAQI